MKKTLAAHISNKQLEGVAKTLAKYKTLKLDGILVKFYHSFWYLIGSYFYKMLQWTMEEGKLPNGVNIGLITLIFKFGNSDKLSN